MLLVETESLVINSYNLAEADRIVVFLTRDHGMVRGVAKGAKRMKSRFGSSLEPFSVVQLTYVQKEAVELVSIQRADLIRSYFEVASNPDFLHKFSYLADLLVTFSPPHDPNETLYRMARACLETAAADAANIPSMGTYFELWLLRLGGYLPDWRKCERCRREFDEFETVCLQTNFHLVCQTCPASRGSEVLDGSQRQLYLSALRLSPDEFARSSMTKDDQLRDVSAILRRIITYSAGYEVMGEVLAAK